MLNHHKVIEDVVHSGLVGHVMDSEVFDTVLNTAIYYTDNPPVADVSDALLSVLRDLLNALCDIPALVRLLVPMGSEIVSDVRTAVDSILGQNLEHPDDTTILVALPYVIAVHGVLLDRCPVSMQGVDNEEDALRALQYLLDNIDEYTGGMLPYRLAPLLTMLQDVSKTHGSVAQCQSIIIRHFQNLHRLLLDIRQNVVKSAVL